MGPSHADINSHKQYFLLSGSIVARKDPCVITTILGSCVSVCLWDPSSKIGGMNHYMLPFWNGEGLASPKYGSIAVPKLIEKVLHLGAARKNLQAKVFGGGEVLSVTNSVMNIGERNILFARDILEKERIPIISADVGGDSGRKIVFDICTGSVFVKKILKKLGNAE